MIDTGQHQKRILLAEDDPSISEIVSIILKEGNYRVLVPKNYSDLLRLLADKSFDLVLMDVWLWGKNGGDLCKTLKINPDTRNIPVILLSARSDIRDLVRFVNADDLLEKPFDIEVLISKVKKYL